MLPSAGNKEDDELYIATGHFVIGWAFMEMAITHWIAAVYHSSANKSDQPLPGDEFKRKTDFLRDQFKKQPRLEPYKRRVISLLDDAGSLFQTRTFVVHGAISDIDMTKRELHFVALRADTKAGIHNQKRHRLTFDRLISDGNKCHAVAGRMMTLTNEFFDAGMVQDKS